MDQKIIQVTVGGISLDIAATYRKASEDLVFFIHGLGCSKESFQNVWHRSEFRNFSLLAIDLAGFGESSGPGDAFSYSMEDHARVCDEVLDAFKFNRLHVVGHSMGGAVGLLLSEEIFHKTISFSNIEGNLIGEDCGLISMEASSVSYDIFENELFPHYRLVFHNTETRGLSLDTASPLAFYKSSTSLVAWSDSRRLLNRFKALKCKKRFFYGERHSGLKVLNELGNIETEAISGSGHFLMNDNPDEFYTKLFQFIRTCQESPFP